MTPSGPYPGKDLVGNSDAGCRTPVRDGCRTWTWKYLGDVAAGGLVLVADPTATLYLQAGNDAAVAFGFAAPGVLVALG